jgi:hypothetical protein
MGVTRLPGPDPHSGHDLLLIAAFAVDDVSDAEREEAEALIRECSACAALAADVRSIQRATSALPVPVRTRDFRLTPDDAERLRPRGWRRWVAVLGSPGFAPGRPLAVAFTTLGVVGLLLATIPEVGSYLPFAAQNERTAMSASDRQGGGAPGPRAPTSPGSQVAPSYGDTSEGGSSPEPAVGSPATPSAAASPVPAYGVASPVASAPPGPTGAPGEAGVPVPGSAAPGNATAASPATSDGTGKDSAAGIPPTPAPSRTSASGSTPWLAGISIALLAAGLGLFLARWLVRRAGPRAPTGR